MEKINKKQTFTSKFYNVEKINPFFSRVKIYVMYEGVNRNGFYINKETINNAIPTIYNTPIVGEFLVDEKNFSDHGASIVKDDNNKDKIVLSTRPYGVIPESANIYWELVKDEDGSEHEYLVVDGAYLWSGRYPELNTIFDEGYYGQSMEILIENGQPIIQNGIEVFNIKEFIFTAFCLLGISKESDMFGYVQPVFSGSRVEPTTYSLDKNSFKAQFSQMINELKFTLKGGNSQMEETKAQDELKKRLEDNPQAAPIVDSEKEPEDTQVEVPQNEPQPTETTTQVETVVDESVGVETEPTVIQDANDATGDGVESNTDGSTEPTTFSKTEDEFNTLRVNFEALQSENFELREYKRNRELSDLKQKFSTQTTELELDALFEENKVDSIQELELKVFALIGQKNFSLNDSTPKTTNKVSIISPKADDTIKSPYGDIKFLR